MTRKRRKRGLAGATPTTLVAVCGLAKSVHGAVRAHLELNTRGHGRRQANTVEVQALSAPERGPLYPQQSVAKFVKVLAGIALRKRQRESDPAARVFTPRRYLLLYVRAADDGVLLSELGLAPLPVAVGEVGPWQFDVERAKAAFLGCLQHQLKVPSEVRRLQQSIEAGAGRSCAVLPPRNFKLTRDRSLALELTRRAQQPGLLENLEGMVQRIRVNKKRVPIDFRHRVYPTDRNAHGLAGDELLKQPPRRALERLYRLGFPLPDGFHHDVARKDGRRLDGDWFECIEHGRVQVRDTHANVYPDDFVRATFVDKKKTG